MYDVVFVFIFNKGPFNNSLRNLRKFLRIYLLVHNKLLYNRYYLKL